MRATNQTFDSVSPYFRRAGGRRAFNALRQREAEIRRIRVAMLLLEVGFLRGSVSEIARRLGVHRSTVCRDVQFLELMGTHGFKPWQLALIRRDDRTLSKLVYEPRLKCSY